MHMHMHMHMRGGLHVHVHGVCSACAERVHGLCRACASQLMAEYLRESPPGWVLTRHAIPQPRHRCLAALRPALLLLALLELVVPG
jgi:hypothetical protein